MLSILILNNMKSKIILSNEALVQLMDVEQENTVFPNIFSKISPAFQAESARIVNPQTALRLYAVMKISSFRRLALPDLKGRIFITAGQRPAGQSTNNKQFKINIV
jgi:hypothetical protein